MVWLWVYGWKTHYCLLWIGQHICDVRGKEPPLSCFLSVFSFPSLWLWNLSQWAKYSGAEWAVGAQDRWDSRPASATAQHTDQLTVKHSSLEREREKKQDIYISGEKSSVLPHWQTLTSEKLDSEKVGQTFVEKYLKVKRRIFPTFRSNTNKIKVLGLLFYHWITVYLTVISNSTEWRD